MKTLIGPAFAEELKAAGLTGLPFSWSDEGDLQFGDAMTPEQVAAVNAVLSAHDPAAPSWSSLQELARAALATSDTTILRTVENGIVVPQAWVAYRAALRGIVSAASGDSTQALPTRPPYPDGS